MKQVHRQTCFKGYRLVNSSYFYMFGTLEKTKNAEGKNVQRIIQKICKIPAGKSAKYSDNKSSNQFARIFTGERTLHV